MTEIDKQKELLLVNSHPERFSALKELLSSNSQFKLYTATNAKDAVHILKTYNITFIVSNIKLGDFDGWRLARLVRSGVLKCASDIPFVIVANTWCQHLANTTAREFGVNRLIPFEQRNELPNIINNQEMTPLQDMEKSPLLIIEDNPDTQHLAGRILSSQFRIDTATDGFEGLAKWKQNNYSLVLLDVMLPGLSGNQILKQIIQEKPSQSVVIMTANHTMELAEELMLAGAADFVTKPFRAEKLRQVCSAAARREDYIISNEQFAEKIDSLRQSQQEVQLLSDTHQQLLDQLGSVVIKLRDNGEISFLNKAWEKLTGFSIQQSQQNSILDFIVKENRPGFNIVDEFDRILSGETVSHQLEFKLKNNMQSELWVEAKFEVRFSENKRIQSITGTIDNITDRKKALQDLEHLAMHDGLTGLFNRHYFEIELKQFTATAQRGFGPHALLYIDLDHFKIINDTAGHYQGDLVLKNISSLIKERLRGSDILCRVGGDEFALLLPNTNQDKALTIADNIRDSLDQYQCKINGQAFKVNCSIGIAPITESIVTSEDSMKYADIALYVAKKQGRNMVHIYAKSDAQSEELQASLEWSRKIQQAIVDDDLILHFQPIIEISTGKVAYYEALVRLKLNGKIIPPNQFIPSLEREGNMDLLDRQVIKKAIDYLAQHPKLTRIAVNLSAQGFSDERLVPIIEEALVDKDVNAHRIIFELTESASLNNLNATQKIVDNLGELGCAFSIDDFGTGFSTFNYLKQLPAESVKIDGSFVVDLATNPVDLALVKAIYEVATALGKKTVAEFVENQETLDILSDIGVTYAQGYHLSKPLPIDELFN